jgi:penicillin-binding protein 1A
MDEYTDAWFVGFDPNITVGVWIGYDEKKPLGRNESGAVAALPVWVEFMRGYIEARANRASPPQFEAPSNIVFMTLGNGAREVFINGTQPDPLLPTGPVPAGTVPATLPAPPS